MAEETHILARLMATIEDRKKNPPAKSYTSTLFAGGVAKIGEKIREEAEEVSSECASRAPPDD